MKLMVQNRAKVCLIVSAAILVIALLMTVIGTGINQGIDFVGGVALRYDMGEAFEMHAVRAALSKQGLGAAQAVAQTVVPEAHDHAADPNHEAVDTAGADKNCLEVRVKSLADSAATAAALETALRETYPNTKLLAAEKIGATAGKDLMESVRLSMLIACVLVLIYVAIRFELLAGAAAVLGILHDVFLMLALVVILRIPVNTAFYAVPLAILAYSAANTLVIFTRIRETTGKGSARNLSRAEVVTRAAQEALPRTLGIALVALLVTVMLWILGVAAVKEIALPLLLGMLVCLYSSNMLTGYVWAWLLKLRGNK